METESSQNPQADADMLVEKRNALRAKAKELELPSKDFLAVIKEHVPSGKLPEATEEQIDAIAAALDGLEVSK